LPPAPTPLPQKFTGFVPLAFWSVIRSQLELVVVALAVLTYSSGVKAATTLVPNHGRKQLFPLFVASVQSVCARSPAGIAGSNPAEVMDVYLLSVLCVVRSLWYWPITHPEESYRVCVVACDLETSTV